MGLELGDQKIRKVLRGLEIVSRSRYVPRRRQRKSWRGWRANRLASPSERRAILDAVEGYAEVCDAWDFERQVADYTSPQFARATKEGAGRSRAEIVATRIRKQARWERSMRVYMSLGKNNTVVAIIRNLGG